MKKLFIVIGAFALVAASCGGDSAASCADIADDGVAVFQEVIDQFDNMSAEDMQAFSSGEEPAFVSEMTSRLEELDQRANDAGCTDADLEALFQDRVSNLTAKTEIGQMMIDGFAQSGFSN